MTDEKEVKVGEPTVEDEKDTVTTRLVNRLPCAQRYEESWMHRGNPTHVCCSPTGVSEFFMSGADDGRIKLWRSTALIHSKKKGKGAIASEKLTLETARQGVCLEFVKDFQAHSGPIQQIIISNDGFIGASIGVGETLVKVYNVRTFDLFSVRRLPFVPSYILIIPKKSPGDYWLLASDSDSNKISVFNLVGDTKASDKVESGDFFEGDESVKGIFGGSDHGSIQKNAQTGKFDKKRSRPDAASTATNDEKEGGLIYTGGGKKQKTETIDKVYQDLDVATEIWSCDRHNGPVHRMTYVPSMALIVSADRFGGLEIWGTSLFDEYSDEPKGLKWSSKLNTDFFELFKSKTYALSIATTAEHGGLLAASCGDFHVRLWSIQTGKLLATFDETIRAITMSQMESLGESAWRKIDNFDFGRRVGVEKELINSTVDTPGPRSIKNYIKYDCHESIVFDESGHFVLFTTLEGIKVMDWKAKKLINIIGRGEQLRFRNFALFQAPPVVSKMMVKDSSKSDNPFALDKRRNMILACALNKRRFFVFSHLEPLEESFVVGSSESRDHLNEAPTQEEREIGMQRAQEKLRLRFGSGYATLHTIKGDIKIQLNMEDTPKTVENFVTHSRNGFYNGLIFHRVIKGFMIQSGCPHGKGTGGESIWGGYFEDEIVSRLRHDRPYMVSMANAGPGTNGSQFFITTVPCPHLDGKHTIFGKVVEGHDIIHLIENVTVNREDRPYEDIKILNIKIED